MPKQNRQKFADLNGSNGAEPDNGATGAQDGAGADEGGADEGADNGEGDDDGGEKEPEAKYTDAEVDGIVEKRIARERSKMMREIREQLANEAADERTEAEKLAGMTELQRAQYEAKKLQRENAALKAEKSLEDQKAVARKELGAAGINISDALLSMFVAPEAERTNAAIEALKELWPAEVNKAVQAALRRNPPDADKGRGSTPSYGATYAKNYSKNMIGGN